MSNRNTSCASRLYCEAERLCFDIEREIVRAQRAFRSAVLAGDLQTARSAVERARRLSRALLHAERRVERRLLLEST